MKSVVFLLVAGCAVARAQTVPPTLLTAPLALQERATLKFSAETGTVVSSHIGIATLKRQTSRRFTFQLPKETQELHLTTCHRELSFWKPSLALTWNYIPALALSAPEPVEYAGNCLLIATAITNRGKVLRGIVSFSGDENGKAKVYCDVENGIDAQGHFMCQGRAALSQALVFDKQMHATWKNNCGALRTNDNRGFSWELSPGLCTYAFLSFDKTESFRLTTYGYSSISLPDYE